MLKKIGIINIKSYRNIVNNYWILIIMTNNLPVFGETLTN